MSKIKPRRKRKNQKLLVVPPSAPVVRRAVGTVFEVTSYSYTIHTPGRPDYLVFDTGLLKVRGVIDCVGEGYHAYIIALADDSLFPLNRYYPSDKTVWIF